MSNEKAKTYEQLISFGITIDEDIIEILEKVDDHNAWKRYREWLEKTDGDPVRAWELHPLPLDITVRKEAVAELSHWEDWTRHEVHNPPRFKCPGCGDEYMVVELNGKNDPYCLDVDWGEINRYIGVEDEGSWIFNYDILNQDIYEDYNYWAACGHCSDKVLSGHETETVLVEAPDRKRVRFNKIDTLAVDEGEFNRELNVLNDLEKDTQKAVGQILAGNKPDGWVKIDTSNHLSDEKPRIRRNMNKWIHQWAIGGDRGGYHFKFPTIVHDRTQDLGIGPGYLYVPDTEEYIEEAKSWVSPERMKNFRR